MTPVEITRGDSPVILGLPHTGTHVPEDILARLNARGRELTDTDWHVHELYDGLLPGATTVRATFHRYVIDANRPPEDESLYPGQNTTGLVPLTDFDGEPIWDTTPDAAETARRLAEFHAPYHAALAAEIARVRARHGVAILYDCHSIRSVIPYLFEGTLPDFNIGTANGTTCAPAIAEAAASVCAGAEGYSHVQNGRFKGGWTTRHYGRPETGVHAIQMELAQSTHLTAEAAPF
ncbi:N-formylglutamate deformylase, partial [Rhodovulum sulfidophilum]|uniref:N-formylglutamate deformylase n=1 Tax=Rhodovulum sulfidophilum TaxID=35806 RepID=UPI0019230946